MHCRFIFPVAIMLTVIFYLFWEVSNSMRTNMALLAARSNENTVDTDYRRYIAVYGNWRSGICKSCPSVLKDPERTHDLPLRRSSVSISVQTSRPTGIETLSEIQLHAPLLLFLVDTICCNGYTDWTISALHTLTVIIPICFYPPDFYRVVIAPSLFRLSLILLLLLLIFV